MRKSMTIISKLLSYKLNLLKKIKKWVEWRKLSKLNPQILLNRIRKSKNFLMILLKPTKIRKIRMTKSNSLMKTSIRKKRNLLVLPMIIKNLFKIIIDFLMRFRTLMTKLLNLKPKSRNYKRN